MSEYNHTSSTGESHGSVGSYLTGFVLAVVLTVASFAVVLCHSFSHEATLLLLSVLAMVQILVHLRYFLHMGGESEHRWNNIVFIAAIAFVGFFIVGTMFAMNNAAFYTMSRGL